MSRFVRFEELAALGIPFSRVHVDRLQRDGKFPKKIRLGTNTCCYLASEIETWLAARIADRDGTGSGRTPNSHGEGLARFRLLSRKTPTAEVTGDPAAGEGGGPAQ
jgi:prophage regulatory protein